MTGKVYNDRQFDQLYEAVCSYNLQKRLTAIQFFGVNATNQKGETVLMRAAQKGNAAAVRFLLGNRADFSLRAKNGTTALFECVRFVHPKSIDVARALIENGANPDAPGEMGMTPLIISAQLVECPAMTRLLIDRGASVNLRDEELGISPLYQAAYCGNFEAQRVLLERGADVNVTTRRGENPLFAAVEMRKFKEAQYLLVHAHVNPNLFADGKTYSTPLFKLVSSYRGEKDIPFINLLLQHGASCAPSIAVAIKEDNMDVLKVFRKAGVDFNLPWAPGEDTPLMVAAANDKGRIIRWLLDQNVDPNCQNDFGCIALHMCCTTKHERAFNALVGVSNIHRENFQGITPLIQASGEGAIALVNELIKRGADLNHAAQMDGSTALHRAVKYRHIVIELVRNGADVNARMNDGATPALIAAQEGYHGSLEFLLKNGGDHNAVRNDGNTSLFMAHKYGHFECVKLIVQAEFGSTRELRTVSTTFDALIPGSGVRLVEFSLDFIPEHVVRSDDVQDERPLRGAQYLLEQGFSQEQIEEMRSRHSAEEVGETPIVEEIDLSTIGWFGGAIKADDPNIHLIEGTHKSHNCFIYITPECRNEPFTTMPMKFCGPTGEQGIKRLSQLIHPFTLRVQGKEYEVRFTDEIKPQGTEERILCCRIVSDNERETLLIGCHFLPRGLHKKNVRSSLPKDLSLTLSN